MQVSAAGCRCLVERVVGRGKTARESDWDVERVGGGRARDIEREREEGDKERDRERGPRALVNLLC